MAGTREGGRAAARTNKSKYGTGFYSRIGSKGGSNGNTGGFASQLVGSDGLTGKQRARVVGAIGGRHSVRPKDYISNRRLKSNDSITK